MPAILTAMPVANEHGVELLRTMRNATRQGFSYFNDEISAADQAAWWERMRGKVLAWIYATARGLIVGFGVLRQTDDGRWWTTTGILPEHRGHNYGKAIMHDLVTRSPEPPWSAARRDNLAAQKLHVVEEWIKILQDDRLIYYRARGPYDLVGVPS